MKDFVIVEEEEEERIRNIFSSNATKCTYQIGHISQRQDLMVQQ